MTYKIVAKYIKDLSFENKLAFDHKASKVKPEPNFNLDIKTATLGNSIYQVSLVFNVHAKIENDTDFVQSLLENNDVAVVHNGQLTNYWNWRRNLEHRGHRFMSNCDSELIAVYIANKIRKGIDLEDAMESSLEDLDGVFTYLVATKDKLGMAKDHMAAKPMVLYESDDLVALASEEVAIRSVMPTEIDTYDPYEGEVKVWQA